MTTVISSSYDLLAFPILIPMMVSGLLYFLRKHQNLVTILSTAGMLCFLAIAVVVFIQVLSQGIQVVSFGNWPIPFGIVLVGDLFSASMVLITAIIGLFSSVYGTVDLKGKPSFSLYFVLMHALLAGVSGAFLTGDLFNLYVWFEVILITSFGLMTLDASRNQIHGANKYVLLNLIATLAFLLGIGLLYGATGTLNFADLNQKVTLLNTPLLMVLSALFLFGFGIKAAVFPVFSWLPVSYPTMPSTIVALFAALLTKVGVYALIRFFTIVIPLNQSGWHDPVIWVASLTMVVGVLGAACQSSVKKILSFHIISQIGYMIMGLAIFTPVAIAAAIFYIIHHIIVKTNLFLIGGVLQRYYSSSKLSTLGGAYLRHGLLAFLFVIPALSLVGIPPFSGFWGKYILIKDSLDTGHFWLAGAALFTGLLTMFSMAKIWSEAFWKPAPDQQDHSDISHKEAMYYYIPIIALAFMTCVIGLWSQPFLNIAMRAAESLVLTEVYVTAVLEAR